MKYVLAIITIIGAILTIIGLIKSDYISLAVGVVLLLIALLATGRTIG